MKSVLMGVLAGLSFGCLAAPNCNDIKTNCIDNYPEGEKCMQCPFWAHRDRWSGEIVQ
jgi:hypothetical protein